MPGDGLTHGPPATKKQVAVTTGQAGSTGIPCAMVLTLMSRSPWGPGSLAPMAREIISRTWPQRREARTTRFCVRIGAVRPREQNRARRQSVHRIPRSTFVTIAKRPHDERGTARIMLLIWRGVKFISGKPNTFAARGSPRRAICARHACTNCPSRLSKKYRLAGRSGFEPGNSEPRGDAAPESLQHRPNALHER